MKSQLWLLIIGLSCLFNGLSFQAYGQIQGNQSQSSPFSSSIRSIQTEPLRYPSQQQQNQQPATPETFTPRPQPVFTEQVSRYFHPGILVYRNGEWQGGDHLLNLGQNIRVSVEIVKPTEATLPITDQGIKQQVETLFQNANISPNLLVPANQPPLPAFQIEVLIYPIERGYVACCAGRLFESVILPRFNLEPGTFFQAITWEKKNLIVVPTQSLEVQLQRTIAEITQAFIDRFQVYEQRRRELMGLPG